jgi:3-oxoacyl-[acyl-carrier-protein] synthase-3
MSGNATYRYGNVAILSVCGVDAPHVVISDEFDARLAPTYRRVGLRPGLLRGLAGIAERRWWPPDVTFSDSAAMAGAKALAEAGVEPGRVGLLIDTSVSRSHLEPSSAVAVHSMLDLPSACMNFDLANACLGFLNGMQLAATMIDTGRIDYALVVDGEGTRHTHQVTLDRLSRADATREDVLTQFATLTLGSGAAAMVLARSDLHPDGHRFLGGAMRTASEHHRLCVGDLESMLTDSKGLLDAGVALGKALWEDARSEFAWSDMDCYIAHQISHIHTRAMCRTLDIDPDRVPLTYPTRGNMGPAAVPFTLAMQADSLQAGDRLLLLGVGSGLNASFAEVLW